MMDLDIVLNDVLSKKLQITTALAIIKENLAFLEGQLRQISPFESQHEEPCFDPIIEEEPEEIRPILYTIQKLSKALHRPPYLRDHIAIQENFIEEIREVMNDELDNVVDVVQKVTRNSSFGKLKFRGTLRELCIWLDEMQKAGILEVAPGRSAVISCFQVDNRDIQPESYSVTKSRLKKAQEDEEERKAHARHKEELLGTVVNQSSPGS
jgi:hypothetical protein